MKGAVYWSIECFKGDTLRRSQRQIYFRLHFLSCFVCRRLCTGYSTKGGDHCSFCKALNKSFTQSKSMAWFLYDRDFRHERVKGTTL